MHLADNFGIEKITELGSGKVLTGISKRMFKNIFTECYENLEDFKNII